MKILFLAVFAMVFVSESSFAGNTHPLLNSIACNPSGLKKARDAKMPLYLPLYRYEASKESTDLQLKNALAKRLIEFTGHIAAFRSQIGGLVEMSIEPNTRFVKVQLMGASEILAEREARDREEHRVSIGPNQSAPFSTRVKSDCGLDQIATVVMLEGRGPVIYINHDDFEQLNASERLDLMTDVTMLYVTLQNRLKFQSSLVQYDMMEAVLRNVYPSADSSDALPADAVAATFRTRQLEYMPILNQWLRPADAQVLEPESDPEKKD